ncbi:MAG: hypothetical protein WCA85_08180, partial [Paraburkholderia sp.]|uniref:hypothetical protein n=1 Tax=Paraburkholderia sp. TaxID=1926495 RepID=UPI003C5D35E9
AGWSGFALPKSLFTMSPKILILNPSQVGYWRKRTMLTGRMSLLGYVNLVSDAGQFACQRSNESKLVGAVSSAP